MINTYLPILFLLLVAVAMPVGIMISSYVLGPKVKAPNKLEPYECGIPPLDLDRGKISIKFYRVAVLFLLFDVEAAFLFPWAVIFKEQVAVWGFSYLALEFFLFLAILMVGFFFAWKKGALEWD